jgi:hypothetical protein
MNQPAMEEFSMSVSKEHLLTFRTAAAAFCKTVQEVCQEGAERFLSGGLKITEEVRDKASEATIYTVRMNPAVLARLRKEADKREVSVSGVLRAWAIELASKHAFEISYLPIDFKGALSKNLSEYPDVQAVQLVRGKQFKAQLRVPLLPPFKEGATYAKGRKVARVDLDKLGKFWVLYIVNG